MPQYVDLTLQGSMKEQLFRCKLHLLERRCSGQVEKLQSGTSVSFITLRRTLPSHSGCSKYSRDSLRLFPDAEEEAAPLCL